MAQNKSHRLLWAVCLAALAAFAAAMVWLHYQQLCSPGGGSDPYTSDLGMHLAFAQRGMVYSTVSLLIGPAYALAGRVGIAVLLAAFHLAAVAVFACGLRTALPDAPRPARLLVSLVVNLATAVWMPRGGYWYQGTVGGTIYHNTTYIMLAPFALLAMLAFYRVWPTMRDDLDLRAYAVYTVLLTVATSFKASLIFAFAPTLLVLLIADFIRTRAKNLKNEILIGSSVFPRCSALLYPGQGLVCGRGSGIRLISPSRLTITVCCGAPSTRPACWGWPGPSSLWRLWGCCSAVRRGSAFATGSAFSPLPSRWPRRCCWSKAASGSITPISGGGPFICFWVFWLESVSVFCAVAGAVHRGGGWSSAGSRWSGISSAVSASLSCCLQGVCYNVPILTYNLW